MVCACCFFAVVCCFGEWASLYFKLVVCLRMMPLRLITGCALCCMHVFSLTNKWHLLLILCFRVCSHQPGRGESFLSPGKRASRCTTSTSWMRCADPSRLVPHSPGPVTRAVFMLPRESSCDRWISPILLRVALVSWRKGKRQLPPVVPFYPFLGEGSPTKIDCRKRNRVPLL